MKQVIASCRYNHPVLGRIHVKVNGSTRAIRARWVGSEVCITVPPRLDVCDYERFISDYQEQILLRRPKPKFYPGLLIDCPCIDIAVDDSGEPGCFMKIEKNSSAPLRGKKINYMISLGRDSAARLTADPELQRSVNEAVISVAAHASVLFMLPRARELALGVGRRPLGWDIKETKTRLGSCSSEGIITLSPRLIFLPPELADYIIYHEIAHLSEMNHSEAFHTLCNEYCGGREAEFRTRVRQFEMPVF